MSIANDGALHTKAELEALRKENDELKKLVAELSLDNKIFSKKGRDGRTEKKEVLEITEEFGVSMNRVIKVLGICRSTLYR